MRPSLLPLDEPVMQVGRNDAELRAKLEHVPVVVAKHPHRRRVVGQGHGAVFVGQQAHQHRLAGAVGAENHRVLTGDNFQREAMKDRGIPFFHGRV